MRFARTMVASMLLATAASGSPAVDDDKIIASVNGEAITYAELERAIGAIHMSAEETGSIRGRQRPSDVLERLITLRLIAQEGRNIGLDQLPEVRTALAAKREQTLRELLLKRPVEEITEPDPDEVAQLYLRSVGEVRLATVRFDDAEPAVAFRDRVDAGEPFDTTAASLVDGGGARSGGSTDWIALSELLPTIEQAVWPPEVGEVAGPVEFDGGFAVLQVLEIREPDDPEARETAEREALRRERLAAISAYTEDLKKRYVKVDEELMEALDYEAEGANFESFLEDERVVATVEGGEPVTVADLTAGMRKRFFHGTERAAERGRLNRTKSPALHDILVKRVTIVEADRLGIEDTAAFRMAMDEAEEGLVFGSFVSKVVDPDVKIDDEAMRAYYTDHTAEFLSPAIVRLESLTFATRKAAEDAIEKLRSGAAFEWVRLNAGEQVTREDIPDLMVFRGNRYIVEELPTPVQEAVAGAGAGQYRLVDDAGGLTHLFHVVERTAPEPRPFDEVKWEVARQLVDERRNAAVEEWSRKLREASEVEIYVDSEQLHQMLRRPLES